jgi:hypothetical protein
VIKVTILEGKFGAGDTPPCKRCGADTRMIGRETHPDLGKQYELQTFECGSCGDISTRSVDAEGKAPAA